MIEEQFISPTFTIKFPLTTVENKIAVFADLVKGWQLDIAEDLISHNHRAGYAVMHILLSFIEMIGCYRLGVIFRGSKKYRLIDEIEHEISSKKCFSNGLQFIFLDFLEEEGLNDFFDCLSALFYSDLRCALYHRAMVMKNIILTRETEKPFVMQSNETLATRSLIINPLIFTKYILSWFPKYIDELVDEANEELRMNFVYAFENTFQTD